MICPHCNRDTEIPQGMSAQAIFAVLHGHKGFNHPHDPSDFGRCMNYLASIGETTPTWMKDVSPVWSALVDHWDELSSLYEEEQGRAPRLYRRMKEIIRPLERGWISGTRT